MDTTTGKGKCCVCIKEKVVYKCNGCLQIFCLSHLNEHRQLHERQLDQFTNNCDQLRQKFIQQKNDPKNHSLMEQLKKWEDDSIQKIKQTVEECKRMLIGYTDNNNSDEVEKRLNQLAKQIKTIRAENEFNEIDLERIQTQLKQLEREIDQPSNVSIHQDSTTLINKISINIASPKSDTSVITPKKIVPLKKQIDETHAVARPSNKKSSIENNEVFTASKNVRSINDNQQFATPGTYETLYCKGRHCVRCGKCRDWYYTGDSDSWNWIHNSENWTKRDMERWDNDRIWKRFKRRNGATCDTINLRGATVGALISGAGIYSDADFVSALLSRVRAHCLCEDNISC